MKTTTKNTGIKVNASVKAGGFGRGQSQPQRSQGQGGIKAGTMIQSANHNRWASSGRARRPEVDPASITSLSLLACAAAWARIGRVFADTA